MHEISSVSLLVIPSHIVVSYSTKAYVGIDQVPVAEARPSRMQLISSICLYCDPSSEAYLVKDDVDANLVADRTIEETAVGSEAVLSAKMLKPADTPRAADHVPSPARADLPPPHDVASVPAFVFPP